jgi:hypothetical protein
VLLPGDHEYVTANAPSHGLAISPDGTRIVVRSGATNKGRSIADRL